MSNNKLFSDLTPAAQENISGGWWNNFRVSQRGILRMSFGATARSDRYNPYSSAGTSTTSSFNGPTGYGYQSGSGFVRTSGPGSRGSVSFSGTVRGGR